MSLAADKPTLKDVSASQVVKVLERNADEPSSPEARLWFAVFHSALLGGDRKFFKSHIFEKVAPLIGLNPEFVREIVIPWIDQDLVKKDRKARRILRGAL